MASTIAIAASYNISPEILISWISGSRPTEGDDAVVCREIFSKFDYIDGEWLPKSEVTSQISPVEPSPEADSQPDRAKISNVSPSKTEKAAPLEPSPEADSEAIESATKPKSETAPATESPAETATDGEETKPDPDSAGEEAEEDDQPQILFSAIGIIRGEVDLDEEGNYTIRIVDLSRGEQAIGNKIYPLFYAKKNYQAFTGLKKEIAATENKIQRLIVYPKFTHFPKRDQPPRVGFQLVGFDKTGEGIAGELKDNEFKLCGLWQFIPVCRQPCISVFRNFTKQRLDYIKSAEVQSKVNFLKASHLPILWKDSPVKPFRFNPKIEKEKLDKTYFVQIKARFLPQRDCFGFIEQLEAPIEKPPKFLKASKQDKAAMQKKAAKNKPPVSRVKAKPESKVIKSKPKPRK